ncbi:MAG: DegT/DnrJ/EryC1/StrS family aminotransferase [Nitrospirae bacterium]|nr:DegT/DnrJ/EryC1/StrS family aminotransferase [Nitrospirota bacterium]
MIPVSTPCLNGKELEYVTDCIKSSWISSIGKYVTQFEENFAGFCGTAHAISASNGTTALHLALVSLDIGEADEVIVPDLTFVASANAVLYCGARPVFVDADEKTWNIDPSKIEENITERTKAIIVVHLYGHPCDMDPIMKIARQYNLKVIEDAAEAHGAEYNLKRVGSFGDAGVFSFYGNKIITTGEGGMITTNNTELMNKMRMLRDHAMSKTKRYWHDVLGYNYRLTNIQAAIGVAQMEQIDGFIEAKRRNAALYNSLLNKIDGLTLPPEANGCRNVYWMYSVLIEDDFGMSRDDVMARLQEKGIDTRPFFYPLHQLPIYRRDAVYPVSTMLSRKGINLPSGTTLTETDIRKVCEAFMSIKK